MFAPSCDLINQPDVVVVSNKRPIQVYSKKILKMVRLQNFRAVKIIGAGGAISTALRVARHCVAALKDDVGWTAVSEIIDESEISSIPVLQKIGFGEVPNLDDEETRLTRTVKQIIVQVRLESNTGKDS